MSRENTDMLWAMLESKPIAYHPVLARTFGSVTAAILLGQVLWLHGTSRLTSDGWVRASQGFITATTGLTRWEQVGARKVLLAAGVIEYAKRGMPAQAHYRVNRDAIVALYTASKPLPKPPKPVAAAAEPPPAKRDWLTDVVARVGKDKFEAGVRRAVKDEAWVDACLTFHRLAPEAIFDRGTWIGPRGAAIEKFVRAWRGDDAVLAAAWRLNAESAQRNPMFAARTPVMLVPYIEAARAAAQPKAAAVPQPVYAEVQQKDGTWAYVEVKHGAAAAAAA